MTDDLLVATQGAAQRDVRPPSGPPEQPRVGTDTLSRHVSGARRTASLGPWNVWKPGSLGTPGRPGVLSLVSQWMGEWTGATLGHHGRRNRTTGPGARGQDSGGLLLAGKQGDGIDIFSAEPNPAGQIRGRTTLPARLSISEL